MLEAIKEVKSPSRALLHIIVVVGGGLVGYLAMVVTVVKVRIRIMTDRNLTHR
jgi:LPS O-antigen subunit length determinant protein (WzzB/FepE family)